MGRRAGMLGGASGVRAARSSQQAEAGPAPPARWPRATGPLCPV